MCVDSFSHSTHDKFYQQALAQKYFSTTEGAKFWNEMFDEEKL